MMLLIPRKSEDFSSGPQDNEGWESKSLIKVRLEEDPVSRISNAHDHPSREYRLSDLTDGCVDSPA